jgi:hypothetical protein
MRLAEEDTVKRAESVSISEAEAMVRSITG